MEIKIPESLKEWTYEQAKILPLIGNIDGIDDVIKVVSIFTGIDIDELEKVNGEDLRSTCAIIISLIFKYEYEAIRLNIEHYSLIDNFEKMPVRFFIDMSLYKFENEPELMLAFLYYPSNMKYGQKDEYDNLLSMSRDRATELKKIVSIDEYIMLRSYFIDEIDKVNKIIKPKKKKDKGLNINNFAWHETIDLIATTLNITDWEIIYDWNIVKFNHMVKYVEHKIKNARRGTK
jgi:hypothetical protein